MDPWGPAGASAAQGGAGRCGAVRGLAWSLRAGVQGQGLQGQRPPRSQHAPPPAALGLVNLEHTLSPGAGASTLTLSEGTGHLPS